MTEKVGQSRSRLADFLLEYLVFFAIVALVIATAIAQPRFATGQNLTNLMRLFGTLSFVALGMTFVILGGFIDLSIPGMISLTAMVTLGLVDGVGILPGIGEGPALIVGLLFGTLLGVINGVILVVMGANSQAKALFITFGMSQIYRSIALQYTGGFPMNWGTFFEDPMVITRMLAAGTVGPISYSFIIFLFFLVALYIFQSKTFRGRSIMYMGGNITAAELGGISVKSTMIFIYGLCGLMVSIGSIVLFSRVSVTVPGIGDFFERDAILSVVVGGTSLVGGRGSVLRTFMGVTLVILLSNCLNLLDVQTHAQEVVRGAVLVIAIWLDHRRHANG